MNRRLCVIIGVVVASAAIICLMLSVLQDRRVFVSGSAEVMQERIEQILMEGLAEANVCYILAVVDDPHRAPWYYRVEHGSEQGTKVTRAFVGHGVPAVPVIEAEIIKSDVSEVARIAAWGIAWSLEEGDPNEQVSLSLVEGEINSQVGQPKANSN